MALKKEQKTLNLWTDEELEKELERLSEIEPENRTQRDNLLALVIDRELDERYKQR